MGTDGSEGEFFYVQCPGGHPSPVYIDDEGTIVRCEHCPERFLAERDE